MFTTKCEISWYKCLRATFNSQVIVITWIRVPYSICVDHAIGVSATTHVFNYTVLAIRLLTRANAEFLGMQVDHSRSVPIV